MNGLREKIAAQGIARQQWRARIETTRCAAARRPSASIARQQWRARIETIVSPLESIGALASPASNGGRGLKRSCILRRIAQVGIARQQWRARIET